MISIGGAQPLPAAIRREASGQCHGAMGRSALVMFVSD
jgi:hypothetical protein